MFWKLRACVRMDPLQVAMTGVKMGERYLQLFCSDTALTRGLATKTGLSGEAALWAPDESHAARARKAAGNAGVLIDVQIDVRRPHCRGSAASFDMVVIDNTGRRLQRTARRRSRRAPRVGASSVLRQGGRVELIERVRGTSTSEDALRQQASKSVRTLVEKDGFRFVEGHEHVVRARFASRCRFAASPAASRLARSPLQVARRSARGASQMLPPAERPATCSASNASANPQRRSREPANLPRARQMPTAVHRDRLSRDASPPDLTRGTQSAPRCPRPGQAARAGASPCCARETRRTSPRPVPRADADWSR